MTAVRNEVALGDTVIVLNAERGGSEFGIVTHIHPNRDMLIRVDSSALEHAPIGPVYKLRKVVFRGRRRVVGIG